MWLNLMKSIWTDAIMSVSMRLWLELASNQFLHSLRLPYDWDKWINIGDDWILFYECNN